MEPAAARLIAANEALLNADPMTTCDYLRACGLRTQPVRDALVGELYRPPSRELAALRLHTLRVIRGCSWGASEGKAFMSVAPDENESPPVGCHAWLATTRTPAWSPRLAMEAALAEHDPSIRRAIVLTMRKAPVSRDRATFLATMEADAEVMPAAAWVAAA
jgi:hypothetical protein